MNPEELKSKIADVFYKNKLITVYIKDVKNKRLHIVLPTGKEELISQSALVHFEKKKISQKDLNQILSFLKEKQEKREKLKEELDLREVWEVIVDDVEEISAEEVCELLVGEKPEEDFIAGFLRKVAEEKIYFRLKSLMKLKVTSREEVERLLLQRKRELEKLKKILEGERFLDALQKQNLEIFGKEIKDEWFKNFKEFILWEDQTPGGKLAKEVLKRSNIADSYKIFELLVKAGYINEDEYLELSRLHYPVEFSEKELKEAEEILNRELEKTERVDLTHLNTFTIDAEETQDFDDALSVEKEGENTILYVHIAEVAGMVSPFSSLWEGALDRASTLYLPDKIYPMLPFSLSHKKFSLRQNELKPAITFKLKLSPECDVLDFSVFLSFIKVKKRLIYEDVDAELETNKFLKELYQLLMKHKEKRKKAGALAVFLPEIQVKVDEKGNISIKKIEMTPARDLIAEAMILTNTFLAKFLFENQIPAVYRSQPQPFEVIENSEGNLYLKLLQLKYLSKSELSLSPGFHSGLGVEFIPWQLLL
jgi:exoribonuclease-2